VKEEQKCAEEKLLALETLYLEFQRHRDELEELEAMHHKFFYMDRLDDEKFMMSQTAD